MLVANLTYDDYKGKIMGRLSAGTLRRGQSVTRMDREGNQEKNSFSWAWSTWKFGGDGG